jgi:hypothetical protein
LFGGNLDSLVISKNGRTLITWRATEVYSDGQIATVAVNAAWFIRRSGLPILLRICSGERALLPV